MLKKVPPLELVPKYIHDKPTMYQFSNETYFFFFSLITCVFRIYISNLF